MFKKKETKSLNLNQQEISTLIGYGYEITGEINGTSIIRIDGKVTGNVTTEGGLILGDKGVIIGNIKTKSAIIYGTVTGNVQAMQLEIKKTGVVNGDIKTETLEIELGAQYNGKLEMKQLIKAEEKALKAV
ncbi:bactofilin family protein [Nubsella zeaxanthinifaciens]|jgi:cytoskeletal protein CcmA (bactofilin family)|uniref:bactofilin family protein n=1 Tax=Nubsella zeaxanthinifaciens TaxID=392412 RepID=UPI000DE1C5D6|nr:polymer-forming cytoskeletal protein [Nubsella zeaxanthinifaciens]